MSMPDKFTKAYSITPDNSDYIDPRPDAIYVGSGNFTDGHDSSDFYSPSVWYRGGEQTAVSGSVNSWDNKVESRDSQMVGSSVVATTGDASTNYIDYATFNAASDYLKTADTLTNFDIGTGEFEMMAVVRFEDNGNAYQHIASRDAAANNWGWLRRADNAGSNPGKIIFSISSTDPVSADAPAYDTWYILGVSRDSSNNIQLWRDGATDGSSVSNAADLDADNDDELILGAKYSGSAYIQSLLGDMAEFILWETRLTTAKRAAVVGHLQDRYFNTQRAKVLTQEVSGDGDTIDTYYPQVGEIVNISPPMIRSSATIAGDIVGLTEN